MRILIYSYNISIHKLYLISPAAVAAGPPGGAEGLRMPNDAPGIDQGQPPSPLPGAGAGSSLGTAVAAACSLPSPLFMTFNFVDEASAPASVGPAAAQEPCGTGGHGGGIAVRLAMSSLPAIAVLLFFAELLGSPPLSCFRTNAHAGEGNLRRPLLFCFARTDVCGIICCGLTSRGTSNWLCSRQLHCTLKSNSRKSSYGSSQHAGRAVMLKRA